MAGLSSIGFGAQPTTALDDLQSWRAKRQDLNQQYSDASSFISNSLGNVHINQVTGLVNLAANAAAKRLGIDLSTSSTSGSASKAATKSKPTSNSGPSAAYTNIDKFLASLDGNSNLAPSPQSASSTPFDYNTRLRNFDQVAAGQKPTAAPSASTAKFNLGSYLAGLDKITSKPLVNVTV